MWSSAKLTSQYVLTADHGNNYWLVRDGKLVSPTGCASWAMGEPHNPDAPVPAAIYTALRATPGHTLTLSTLLTTLKGAFPGRKGFKPKLVANFLRELNKQGMVAMVSKGTL